MEALQKQISHYEQEINSFQPADANALEEYRIKFLGTKGVVKQLFGEMKDVPVVQKKEAGQLLNAFKQLAESKYEQYKHLQQDGEKKGAGIDITLPGTPLPVGTRHPLRVTENEIVSIFEKVGFSIA